MKKIENKYWACVGVTKPEDDRIGSDKKPTILHPWSAHLQTSADTRAQVAWLHVDNFPSLSHNSTSSEILVWPRPQLVIHPSYSAAAVIIWHLVCSVSPLGNNNNNEIKWWNRRKIRSSRSSRRQTNVHLGSISLVWPLCVCLLLVSYLLDIPSLEAQAEGEREIERERIQSNGVI